MMEGKVSNKLRKRNEIFIDINFTYKAKEKKIPKFIFSHSLNFKNSNIFIRNLR